MEIFYKEFYALLLRNISNQFQTLIVKFVYLVFWSVEWSMICCGFQNCLNPMLIQCCISIPPLKALENLMIHNFEQILYNGLILFLIWFCNRKWRIQLPNITGSIIRICNYGKELCNHLIKSCKISQDQKTLISISAKGNWGRGSFSTQFWDFSNISKDPKSEIR